MSVIHKLREKPEGKRRSVALGVSAGVTSMLAIVWLSTLPARLGDNQELVRQSAPASPSAVFIDGMQSGLSGIRETIKELSGYMSGQYPDQINTDTEVLVETKEASSTASSTPITSPTLGADEIEGIDINPNDGIGTTSSSTPLQE
jgi:hypothetical protein